MTTQTKTAKDPSAEGAPNKQELPDVSAVTALVQKNVERLADLQKATLDALGHQNADVTESLRKSLKSTPASPVVTFLDFAEKGLDGWITAQKNIVDLIVQQSAHSLQATEERTGFAPNPSASSMNSCNRPLTAPLPLRRQCSNLLQSKMKPLQKLFSVPAPARLARLHNPWNAA